MDCELKFRHALFKRGLVGDGERLIVAVSGGVDSMVMLHLFSRVCASHDLSITVAHVNHGLRGDSSDRDERLVREAADGYGMAFASTRWKFDGKGNVQDEARRFRTQFFIDVAMESGAGWVATAHHQDDQAETVLLHMMRGSGLKGLGGIPWIAQLDQGITMIRPLLAISRQEIEDCASERCIIFGHDETNSTDTYTRNEVRGSLIPLMEKFNPNIRANIANMAHRLRDDDEALNRVAKDFCRTQMDKDDEGVAFSREEFLKLAPALRKRVLISAFEEVVGSRADLNADQLDRMNALSHSGPNRSQYLLPQAYRFVRRNNRLYILNPDLHHGET